MFSSGICEIFKNTYFEEQMRTTISEACFFTWTALFDNLHFWFNLALMLQFLYHKVSFTNPPFPIDTSVIRSSFLVMSFQNRYPTYLPAKYFPGLICRLGTRVSSISQTLVQKSEAYFQPSQTSVMDIFQQKQLTA